MPSGPPDEPAGNDKTADRTSASETDSGVTEEISGRSAKHARSRGMLLL